MTSTATTTQAPALSRARVVGLTVLAMLAFAGNSLLCRVALDRTSIDAASFTLVRLVSGAIVLWLIVRWHRRGDAGTVHMPAGNWMSALALFVYAVGFSYAYLSLTAAAGALLLFGAVQATMIGYGLWRGERMRPLQWGDPDRRFDGATLTVGGILLRRLRPSQ